MVTKLIVKNNNINYIINYYEELLSIIEKQYVDPQAQWLANNNDYIEMYKDVLKLNESKIIQLSNFIKKHHLSGFHKITALVLLFDENDNKIIKKILKEKVNCNYFVYKRLLKMVIDIFKEDSVVKFFNSNKDFFEKILIKNSKIFDSVDFNTDFKRFYGYEIGDYNVMFSLITGNFGLSINNQIFCTRKLKVRENANYIMNFSSISFLFHEFSHPYVDQVIEDNYNEVKDYFENYTKRIINNSITFKNAYNSSIAAINEILTRANEVVLTEKYLGKKAANTYINKQIEIGIYNFDDIVKIIRNNKERYVNYNNFFKNEILNNNELFYNN